MALIGNRRLPRRWSRAIVNLIAITIEKARALEDASHAEAARQSEVLKSALLDSLAHDIKTPLTSIKAAVTSLLGTAPGARPRAAHHHQRRGRPAEPTGGGSGGDGAHRSRQAASGKAAGSGGRSHSPARCSELAIRAEGPASCSACARRTSRGGGGPRIRRAGGEAVCRECPEIFARRLALGYFGGARRAARL